MVVFSGFASQDKYYVVLYGYKGNPDKPSNAHTFGVFIHHEVDKNKMEKVVISWLPAKGKVRPLVQVEGKNYGLKEAREMAGDSTIDAEGPFESTEKLFRLAVEKEKQLNQGVIEYKMFDVFTHPLALEGKKGGAENCYHAVGDVLGEMKVDYKTWGIDAAKKVAEHFKKELIDYPKTYPQVFDWLK
jgi:hypothetical protein